MTYTIIVFPDGETWNTADGSSIKIITADQFRQLADDEIDAGDLVPLAEIHLSDFTPEPKN